MVSGPTGASGQNAHVVQETLLGSVTLRFSRMLVADLFRAIRRSFDLVIVPLIVVRNVLMVNGRIGAIGQLAPQHVVQAPS